MKLKLVFLITLTVVSFSFLFSQEKSNAKFGNVTAAHFATKIYSIDSNAQAVVLSDIGYSDIEGNSKGWFSLVYKHYKRIHILNKTAYDAANVSIYLYASDGNEEELNKLKAVTYNLEDGKVVETKLDVKTGVFVDKLDKKRIVKKFTFPNVKEGSIIEYEYTIVSDYLQNLQPWEFQGEYPRLWSEYNLRMPAFFRYIFLGQGFLPYHINEQKTGHANYNVVISEGTGASERVSLSSDFTDHRWVIKNAAAMKEESYTSTIDNYISKIEFQLAEYKQPLMYKNIMGTWENLSFNLMKSESFGEALSKNNGWLGDIISPILVGATDNQTKAKRIYAWVRDNITCTRKSGVFLDQSIKNVIKNRNGSVSEINLLLTAMLRYLEIEANPVLLSTKSHGFVYPLYPLLSRFNYVVCQAFINNYPIFLDASEPYLGFALLPLKCYNGTARVIDEKGLAIEFTADSVTEKSVTFVQISTDEKGKMSGRMQEAPGWYESLQLRKKIKEKGEDNFSKEIKNNFGSGAEISNTVIDSLNNYDEKLGVTFDFDLNEAGEDILYIDPMFGKGIKDNPFKAAERHYPVEMSFAFDEVFSLHMEVPTGYEVDELPKQVVVKLNEEADGIFEYRIQNDGGSISLRSRLLMKRTFFSQDEYEMLREFYSLVVKKHNEQIVFKRKK